MRNHRCTIALVVMTFPIMAATLLFAQSDTSSSSVGHHHGFLGGVVPNAKVIARNQVTQTTINAQRKMAILLIN